MPFRRGLPEQVAGVLGQRIVDGTYGTGLTLPPEAELMASFSVSRPVVREAIKILASKGLVDIRQKVGTSATSREHWALLDPDVLGWQMASGTTDPELLRQLVEVRGIIEPEASRLAALRATAGQVQVIADALSDMWKSYEAEDNEAFIEADLRFHAGVMECCDNRLLQQMNSTIASALRLSRDVTVQAPNSTLLAMPLHQAVLDRIARGQPAAAKRAAERLISRTTDDIATVIGTFPPLEKDRT